MFIHVYRGRLSCQQENVATSNHLLDVKDTPSKEKRKRKNELQAGLIEKKGQSYNKSEKM